MVRALGAVLRELPEPPDAEAIGKAARRGVRVRLLVPGPHNDSWIVRTASYDRFPGLLDESGKRCRPRALQHVRIRARPRAVCRCPPHGDI